MTKLEIIENTVTYYSKDTKRRSIQGGGCVYSSENGNHCAVGRFLKKELKQDATYSMWNDDDINNILDELEIEDFDECLVPRAKGHEKLFWTRLQMLHDGKDYWDSKGLTEEGEKEVTYLKEKYS